MLRKITIFLIVLFLFVVLFPLYQTNQKYTLAVETHNKDCQNRFQLNKPLNLESKSWQTKNVKVFLEKPDIEIYAVHSLFRPMFYTIDMDDYYHCKIILKFPVQKQILTESGNYIQLPKEFIQERYDSQGSTTPPQPQKIRRDNMQEKIIEDLNLKNYKSKENNNYYLVKNDKILENRIADYYEKYYVDKNNFLESSLIDETLFYNKKTQKWLDYLPFNDTKLQNSGPNIIVIRNYLKSKYTDNFGGRIMTDLSLKNDQNTLNFTFWSIQEKQFSNLEIPFVEKEGKIILLPKQ